MGWMADIGAKAEMERLLVKLEEIRGLAISKDDALDLLKDYAERVIEDCDSGWR